MFSLHNRLVFLREDLENDVLLFSLTNNLSFFSKVFLWWNFHQVQKECGHQKFVV